jgi:hypothetical protein
MECAGKARVMPLRGRIQGRTEEMALEMFFAAAVLSANVAAGPGDNFMSLPGYWGNGRAIATARPYAMGRADDVRRPGYNGALWIGRPIIGPDTHHWPLGWGEPGPSAYGASEMDFSVVHVLVGQVSVPISPWEAVAGIGMSHIESARQEWLKERGYIGGVRTFVNDAYLLKEHHAKADIQPRATIQVAPDVTRFKSRMQVKATPVRTPMKTDSIVTVRPGVEPSGPVAINSTK